MHASTRIDTENSIVSTSYCANSVIQDKINEIDRLCFLGKDHLHPREINMKELFRFLIPKHEFSFRVSIDLFDYSRQFMHVRGICDASINPILTLLLSLGVTVSN